MAPDLVLDGFEQDLDLVAELAAARPCPAPSSYHSSSGDDAFALVADVDDDVVADDVERRGPLTILLTSNSCSSGGSQSLPGPG